MQSCLQRIQGDRFRLLTVAAVAFLAATGCMGSAGASDNGYVSRGLVYHFVDSSGAVYTPEGGRFRGDLLDRSVLIPIDDSMRVRGHHRVVANEMFRIQGVDGDEWRVGKSVDPISSPPFCQRAHFVHSYRLATDQTTLHIEPTSTTIGPETPTPTPSIALDGFDLTSAGLIEADWPRVSWNQDVSYEGQTYRPDGSQHTRNGPVDVAFPWIGGGESELLVVETSSQIEPPAELAHVLVQATVMDYLHVYRSADSRFLAVDPCPEDQSQDEYVFYRNVVFAEPENTPTP